MNELTTYQRNWAMLVHLSAGLTQLLLPGLGVLAPLLIGFLHRDDERISQHARTAAIFQAGVLLGTWGLAVLGTALSCFVVGFLLYVPGLLIWAAGIAIPIRNAIRVNNSQPYRYPLAGGTMGRDRPLP